MEKAVLPLRYLAITQGVNEGNHTGRLIIDFGWCGTGEMTSTDSKKCYAPFSGTIKRVADSLASANTVWLESDEPVLYADGTIDYMTIALSHCNNVSHLTAGKHINQFEHYYTMGDYGENVSGEHVHLQVGKGRYTGTGWAPNGSGNYEINNAIHPANAFFVSKDTIIKDGHGYNWKLLTDETVKQYLNLHPSADSWRVYPLDKQPVVGNECGQLYPSQHGGLSYEVLRYTLSDTVVINTEEFGEVQIYIASIHATITNEPIYAKQTPEPIAATELPIGIMVPYAGNKIPENWLVCNGSELSRSEYSELFEIIGTAYGTGNGSTTFNIPDKRGRVSVGLNANDASFNNIGKKGGNKSLQAHTHGFSGTTSTSGNHTHTGNTLEVAMKATEYTRDCVRNISSSADYYNVTITNAAGNHNHTFSGTTANTGNGNAENLQPYEVDQWIIKAKNKE